MAQRKLPHPFDLLVGQTLRKHREARALSLRDAAVEMGISNTLLLKYETGKIRVSVSRMIEIADALGVSPLDVLREVLDQTKRA